MFINFLCLCPLRLAIMLNFNISKVAYYSTSFPRLLAKKMRLGLIKIGIAVPSPHPPPTKEKRREGTPFFLCRGRVRLHVGIVFSPKC